MRPEDPVYAVISYYVMLGKRSDPNPIALFPPANMSHRLIQCLNYLPHNIYHFLEGTNYLQRVLLSGGQSGLQVNFVFNDSILDPSFGMALSAGLNVFLICTDIDEELIEMNISLSRVCLQNCLFWLNEEKKSVFLMPNVISSTEEFWQFLFQYAQPLMDSVESPLSVPLFGGSISFPYFRPANTTYFTLESALGNWGVESMIDAHFEASIVKEKTREAIRNIHDWSRQENNIDLLCQLYNLCEASFKLLPSNDQGLTDQYNPPLLMAAPYTNKDVRDAIKRLAREEQSLLSIDKVVELEQTPNYCYDVDAEDISADFAKMSMFLSTFHGKRLDFLDFAANLHCSFRFSPYLRLPLMCKSVNTDLSFVSAKNNSQLVYSKDRMAYDKAIHRVGELLANKLLAPKTSKMLEGIPTQVVAITDLPIEWMEVGGVPLGFSHDVCRIPETPVSGLLTHYGISRFSSHYKIPRDILSKTLIVFGCREERFKKWQDEAEVVARALGAKTSVCQSIDDFQAAVQRNNPDFLIIDTHGGTDLNRHQSYIYMGNDKVYPQDIADRRIFASLVFVSACNTAPCYNDVNTVGNAFLEVGSYVVTSSYLPLDIDESSMLYIRILHQLNFAAKQSIHRNWLAFISHILRTSFLLTPIVNSDSGREKINSDVMGRVNTLSMFFDKRAEMYRKLKNGEEVEGLQYDYSKAIPHYLMYTTIGRADLIEFEVSSEKCHTVFEKILV